MANKQKYRCPNTDDHQTFRLTFVETMLQHVNAEGSAVDDPEQLEVRELSVTCADCGADAEEK